MRRLSFLAAVAVSGFALVLGCQREEGPPVETMVDGMMAARAANSQMPPLTLTYGDFSINQAYRVQEALTARLVKRGRRVAGSKVGYASPASQAAWGIAEPAYGRLYDFQEVPDGAVIAASDFSAFHIEVEVAFIMGKRVGRRLRTVEDLKPYVAGVSAGFDIPDNRFRETDAKASIADIIASGVGAHRWAIGPIMDPECVDVDALVGTIVWNGDAVYSGESTAVMGSPWRSLLWLANSLLARGYALEQGDVVLTGALDKAFSGDENGKVAGTYCGDCGDLGRVTVTVSDVGAK